ncbi:MAG: hypothetical protein ABW328_02740 [Ilumatobacteraceae bacterium]
MKRRRVFVDGTFLRALVDEGDPRHGAARAAFAPLLDAYERGDALLYSDAAAVAAAEEPRTLDVMRPGRLLAVRRATRRDATRLVARRAELRLDQAVTLVLLRRHQIAEIATFDPLYEGFDVGVIGAT